MTKLRPTIKDIVENPDNYMAYPDDFRGAPLILDRIEIIIKGMVRSQPFKQEDFDAGWNNALYALLDELGLGEDDE